jgi:hypothetical protein
MKNLVFFPLHQKTNPIFSAIAHGDQDGMGVSRRFDGLFKGKKKEENVFLDSLLAHNNTMATYPKDFRFFFRFLFLFPQMARAQQQLIEGGCHFNVYTHIAGFIGLSQRV